MPPRGNVADDARTRLRHCGYAHDGVGKQFPSKFLLIGDAMS